MNVRVFPAATGFVPDLFPKLNVKLLNAVEPRLIVLFRVAVEEISAVIKMYPEVPAVITCDVNEGKVLLPATPGVVNVLSVASPPSNVASVE